MHRTFSLCRICDTRQRLTRGSSGAADFIVAVNFLAVAIVWVGSVKHYIGIHLMRIAPEDSIFPGQ